MQQWIGDFVTWVQTADGQRAVFVAAIIIIAAVIGALIAGAVLRSAIHRLLRQQQEERKNTVIATLVDAAVEASVWNSLSSPERVLNDRAVGQAQTHLRLLPVKGSAIAANWAEHELAELKRSSATGGYQVGAAVTEFRDRLVLWRDKPRRGRKAFLNDLERWRFTDDGTTPPVDERVSSQSESTPTPTVEAAPAPVQSAPSRFTRAAPASIAVTPESRGKADGDVERPVSSVPTIVLPPSSSDTATQKLLADVDRLEVRHEENPVEEFAPVEHEQRDPSVSQDTVAIDRHGEPRGTL